MNSLKMGAALAAAMLLYGPAFAADSVKIGFMTTLSGPGGGVGTEMRDGFQLAVKHADGKLGGLPTEVLVVDDQQKPDVGAQIVDEGGVLGHLRLLDAEMLDDDLLNALGNIAHCLVLPVYPTNSGRQGVGECRALNIAPVPLARSEKPTESGTCRPESQIMAIPPLMCSV